jgi:N-acetylglutamate synthase-like GNAT family acetyltransferase
MHFLQAQPHHRPALEDHLTAAGLPVSDLPSDLSGFFLAFDGTRLVGSAGVETLGSIGLLRSVAVDPAYRNLHIAQRLQQDALDRARERGLREVYLITTTADRYFENHGFRRMDRTEAPAEVAQTDQFSSLCAASAVVMKTTL